MIFTYDSQLIISISIRVIAIILSIILLGKIKDWRMSLLTLMLLLMAIQQGLRFFAVKSEFPGLIVSILALLVTIFMGRLIVKQKKDRESLKQLNKTLEQKIAERTAELIKSEESYRSLVRNIEQRHFIYNHNREGVFTYISPSITSIIGYSPEEFTTYRKAYLTDNPVNKSGSKFTELALNGKSQSPYELELYHKDGHKIWLEVVELPVMDKKGNIIGIHGIAQDIADRKKAQEAHLMNVQVETMQKLIRGLSHEIRNPLFGISATSQILQREIKDEKYLPMIRALNIESNRIANLITELNMCATPKAPTVLDIRIGSLIDKLQLKFSEKYPSVTFKINIESSLTIKADESMLACSLEQLLENSCQASVVSHKQLVLSFFIFRERGFVQPG